MVSEAEYLTFHSEMNALDAKGQWAEAERLSRRMLARLGHEGPKRAVTLDFLARCLLRQEKLDEALEVSEKAVTLAHRLGEIELLAWALDRRAHIRCCTEAYPEALRCLQAAEDYLHTAGNIDCRLAGRLAQTRGMAYCGCGWWEAARLNLSEAVWTFERLQLRQQWSTAIHDFAVAAFMQAESVGPDIAVLTEASQWLEKARREFESSNNQSLLLQVTINELMIKGALAGVRRNAAELWALLERFMAVYQRHAGKTGLLMQRDNAQALMNWAGGCCRVARAWSDLDVPPRRREEVLNGVAEILRLALSTVPRHAALWCQRSALHRCRARHGLQDSDGAVLAAKACLENAVDILRQGAAGYLEPQLRAGWLGSSNRLLEELAATAHFAVKETQPPFPEVAARLVSLAQFLRARGRRDMVRNLKYLEDLPESDREKLDDLQARVGSLQSWLDRLDEIGRHLPDDPSRGLGAIAPGREHDSLSSLELVTERIISRFEDYKSLIKRWQVEKELQERKETWEHLIKGSGFLRAQYVQLDSEDPFDLDALQDNLVTGEVVLDYYVGPSALHVGVIDKNRVEVLRLPVSDVPALRQMASEIGTLAEHYLDMRGRGLGLVPSMTASAPARSNGSLTEQLEQCGDWLLPPELIALLDKMKAQRLYAVPSGPLWRIPFPWLRTDDEFAFERWEICLIPSARLAGRETEVSNLKRAFAVGHPGQPNLDNVKNEVNAVGELLGCPVLIPDEADTREWSAGDPTPQRILREVLPVADVIHFACHGFCDPVSPLLSSLLFTPDEQHEDGRLRLHEVLRTPLSASVVNLGACHTARSEGPYSFPESLAHAFLGAGAGSVIASLWAAADDVCFKFANDFYKELKRVRDPATAFRAAQLDQISAWRHPQKLQGQPIPDEELAARASLVLLTARRTELSSSSSL